MMTNKTALDLGNIAARGGSLEVDGSRYTPLDLGNIAARLSAGATLKIHNSDRLTALDAGNIAARNPGKVIFC
ncbi:hypothetical protein [Methylobacterium sp. J-068]|uniref:hypothetical protein n=1 Tax=Methylobacterium sp. J-068 TaxID=2836649 RepID=UPI001FBBEF43|nr:hypothetical protein [Methylobacterium sp. J-068]MCJ2033169.1 hypothetical protein [Methylobacterium sp. J-068]